MKKGSKVQVSRGSGAVGRGLSPAADPAYDGPGAEQSTTLGGEGRGHVRFVTCNAGYVAEDSAVTRVAKETLSIEWDNVRTRALLSAILFIFITCIGILELEIGNVMETPEN